MHKTCANLLEIAQRDHLSLRWLLASNIRPCTASLQTRCSYQTRALIRKHRQLVTDHFHGEEAKSYNYKEEHHESQGCVHYPWKRGIRILQVLRVHENCSTRQNSRCDRLSITTITCINVHEAFKLSTTSNWSTPRVNEDPVSCQNLRSQLIGNFFAYSSRCINYFLLHMNVSILSFSLLLKCGRHFCSESTNL